MEPVVELLALAIGELRLNLTCAERTAFVHGRLPDGHLDRLWRLFQIASRATEWVENPAPARSCATSSAPTPAARWRR